MDIESLLRRIHKSDAHVHHSFRTTVDTEGRVRFEIAFDDVCHVYIMVGDRFIEPPTKPPTQIMCPVGVDTFGPMGARA